MSPYSDSLSLRLARCLTSPDTSNSLARYAKSTPSQIRGSAPTACRRMVSGTISLPLRGTFHLSLTVLVRYRSPLVFSLAGWSPRIRSGLHVSGPTQVPTEESLEFRLRGFNPLRPRLSIPVRLPARFVTPRPPCGTIMLVLQPPLRNARRLSRNRFGLSPLSLATTQGIETFFIFLRVLRCVISPGSLLPPYVFRRG